MSILCKLGIHFRKLTNKSPQDHHGPYLLLHTIFICKCGNMKILEDDMIEGKIVRRKVKYSNINNIPRAILYK